MISMTGSAYPPPPHPPVMFNVYRDILWAYCNQFVSSLIISYSNEKKVSVNQENTSNNNINNISQLNRVIS